MKKLSLIAFLLMFVFAPMLKAQDSDLYSFMSEYLTEDENSQIDRAKTDMKKGSNLDSKIKSADRKISKYFKDGKKGKKKKKSSKKNKKGEKKSVEVKQLRIQQALAYKKAYTNIYNVYLSKVQSCNFEYPEDERKANSLLEEATSNFNAADSKIKSYKKKSKKDLKKSVVYDKLKSDLQSSVSGYKSSIKSLIDAYSVYIDQKQKKQLEEADDDAWMNAKSENTIYSYQSYLNSYRNGKHASEARAKILKLQKEKRDRESRKLNGKLVYRVQIAASRKPLPKWKVRRFHRKTNEVTMKNYDDWYKYSIGEFSKYQQAKDFIQSNVRVKGAFVVAYVNGEKVDIERAIKGE